MAIDASIALNANAPQPVNFTDQASKLLNLKALQYKPQQIEQELATARANQASTEAATPGIAADSAIKQRAASFNQFKTDNASKFVTTDADGNKKFSNAAFIEAASQAGFNTEAQSVAASDLANSSAALTIKRGQTASAGETTDFVKNALNYASTLVSAAPPEQQKELWDKYKGFADEQLPGSGKMFGEYSPDKIGAYRTATMSPQVQAEQQRAADLQLKNFDAENYDKSYGAGGDPGTAAAKLVQDAYLKANPGFDEKEIRKLGVFGIKGLPNGAQSIAEARSSLTLNAPQRAELGSQAVVHGNKADVLSNAAKIAEKFGVGFTGNIKTLMSRVTDPTDRRTLQQGIAALGTGDDTSAAGYADVLRQAAKNETSQKDFKQSTASSATINEKGSPAGDNVGKTQIINNRTGKTFFVSPDELDKALGTKDGAGKPMFKQVK